MGQEQGGRLPLQNPLTLHLLLLLRKQTALVLKTSLPTILSC